MSAITRSVGRSRDRTSRLKRAITPITLRPLVTAKTKLPWSPARPASFARTALRSEATPPLGIPPLTDVGDERDQAELPARPPDGGYRDLNRKLVPVPVKGGQLDRLPEQLAFAGFDEAPEAAPVGLMVPARDHGPAQGATDRLVMAPAENLLRFLVPTGDESALIGGDHRAG